MTLAPAPQRSVAPLNYDRLPAIERQHLQHLIDYRGVQRVPEIWPIAAARFGSAIALNDPHGQPTAQLTFAEVWQQMQQFAAGLQSLVPAEAMGWCEDQGVPIPPRVAMFADNSHRWMIADQGTMLAGFANAVRSSVAETEELRYILEHSGAIVAIFETQKTLDRLAPHLASLPLRAIVLLSDAEPVRPEAVPADWPLLNWAGILAAGTGRSLRPTEGDRRTLATLLYTSGTTGKPKGVMLSHGNLLYQVEAFGTVVAPHPGNVALTILPTWHSFGRIGDYYLLAQGCQLVYTSIRTIKSDFKTYRPTCMLAVPRLWESIYDGAQKQFRNQPPGKQRLVNRLFALSERYLLAKRTWQGLELRTRPAAGTERAIAGLKTALYWVPHRIGEALVYGKVRQATGGVFEYAVSGGGSLATHLELFFETVGINVLVGYGLTETSPVLTVRRLWRNLRGSSGLPLAETEVRIVDPETRQTLPPGQRGLVLARGPQLMQGYYCNPEATAKAIDPEGWFDTGDLGWLTVADDLTLTGRAKDTIVLTNGENIEPQPIEDACIRSELIAQMMLVGQDQKVLGALVVPDRDVLDRWAAEQGTAISWPDHPGATGLALTDAKILDRLRQELNREIKNRPGYKAEERIGPVAVVAEPFSQENGMLTQTLKVRRPVVCDRYRDMIDAMFE